MFQSLPLAISKNTYYFLEKLEKKNEVKKNMITIPQESSRPVEHRS